jgi:hypothetical protein
MTKEEFAMAEELGRRLLHRWGLPPEDQKRLLGRDAESTSEEEVLDRVSWLLSIHKSLRILYPKNPEIYYSWVSQPNDYFGNRAPLEIIFERGLEGMKQIARYLHAVIAR